MFVPADASTLYTEILGPDGQMIHAPMNLNQFLFDMHMNGVAVDPVYALAWGLADAMAIAQWATAIADSVLAGPTSVAGFTNPAALDSDHLNAGSLRAFVRSLHREFPPSATGVAPGPSSLEQEAWNGIVLPSLLLHAFRNSLYSVNRLATAVLPYQGMTPSGLNLYSAAVSDAFLWPLQFPNPTNGNFPLQSQYLILAFILCLVHGTGGAIPRRWFMRRNGGDPPPGNRNLTNIQVSNPVMITSRVSSFALGPVSDPKIVGALPVAGTVIVLRPQDSALEFSWKTGIQPYPILSVDGTDLALSVGTAGGLVLAHEDDSPTQWTMDKSGAPSPDELVATDESGAHPASSYRGATAGSVVIIQGYHLKTGSKYLVPDGDWYGGYPLGAYGNNNNNYPFGANGTKFTLQDSPTGYPAGTPALGETFVQKGTWSQLPPQGNYMPYIGGG